MEHAVDDGWQALRKDPLPWLLDPERPSFHWRVLIELFERPADSPAVRRARSGASAMEPVAGLLDELLPDGSWSTRCRPWTRFRGTAWRLISAVLLGADPDDPRLQQGAATLLRNAADEGGFSERSDLPAHPALTARAVQALAMLGWGRDSRAQEALAWLLELGLTEPGIGHDPATRKQQLVAAVALLGAAPWFESRQRRIIVDALAPMVTRGLARPARTAGHGGLSLGFPNLLRTDLAEMLWALARAGVPHEERISAPLEKLQQAQDGDARWRRGVAAPAGLPIRAGACSAPGEASRRVSLEATVALLEYAAPSRLPRLFPARPAG